MSPYFLFVFVLIYFLLLLGVAWYTSRNADNNSFFIGNRNSNWMLVAFGMIGTSLKRCNICKCARHCWQQWLWLFPGGDRQFYWLLFDCIYTVAVVL